MDMNVKKICGQCWIFGDNIDTDVIMPTQYLLLPDVQAMREHVFEPLRPDFAKNVRAGDVIIAGKNFGCGSSREQAPAALKELKVGAIVSKSFARIFYRNAINLGIPAIECDEIQDEVEEGDVLEINIVQGKIVHQRLNKVYDTIKMPEFLLEIFKYGGLVEYMKRKNT